MTELDCKLNSIKSKIISYIGFAKKSKNIYFGADKVLESVKKGVIIISNKISDNTLNKLENHAKKTNVVLKIVDDSLIRDICDSNNIKVFTVLDENLEKAIIKSLNDMEDIELE